MLHTILRGYPQTSGNFSENTDNIKKLKLSFNWQQKIRKIIHKTNEFH